MNTIATIKPIILLLTKTAFFIFVDEPLITSHLFRGPGTVFSFEELYYSILVFQKLRGTTSKTFINELDVDHSKEDFVLTWKQALIFQSVLEIANEKTLSQWMK